MCAILAAAIAPAGTAAASSPALKLLKANPVQVRATGFHARERVRLTVSTGNGVTHATAKARGDGGFTATVRGAVASRCAPLVIRATGAEGSRAVLRRFPQCTVSPVRHRPG